MDIIEQFKTNAKRSWLYGKAVGAYAHVDGFWAAMTEAGEIEVFDTKKEASKWLKDQYRAKPSDTVH